MGLANSEGVEQKKKTELYIYFNLKVEKWGCHQWVVKMLWTDLCGASLSGSPIPLTVHHRITISICDKV